MPPRRPPIRWPNDARIAIIPAIAFETWPADLGTAGSQQNESRRLPPRDAPFTRNLASITDREFGERIGVQRLLDLFEHEGVHTTFFVNGRNLERLPDLLREIKAQGHEIGTESYIHDYSYMKTPEAEHEDLRKTVAACERVLGERPLGYLSAGVAPTDATPGLIAREGYLYWCDLQHEELPYTLRVDGRHLVALTYMHYINDYSTNKPGDRTPRQLLEIWKDTFDWLYREGEHYPSYMIWGNHPFLSGRPYRARVLEEFIRYTKGFPGVWYCRAVDVARWWNEQYRDAVVEDWPNYYEHLRPGRS
ncbi:MAG: polysaccharide deacetylase family protein [Chloroflexi bacterium]|nr:polysaccharide deacetylase family protein [Chloroflexota bacterium]